MEEAARTLAAHFQGFCESGAANLRPAIISAFMLSFINSSTISRLDVSERAGMNTRRAMMSHIEYNYDPTVSALSVMLMG